LIRGVSIDVKASTMKANWLMVEVPKAQIWHKKRRYPDFIVMVGVDGDNATVLFGADINTFRSHKEIHKFGACIPNTNVPLKADNYMLHSSQCLSGQELINAILNK
jgi:hypothetical protein